ncbi:MAG: hypothetical protein IJV43_05905 [Oscillospiraceae bacterium]|nr:hypothetical protein [Oscillospiraceae bacterium]
MSNKKISPLYKFIKRLVWLFYPKMTVSGAENLPDGPCVIVGNHTQMNGPITCELYTPGEHYTWCAGEMMHLSEVPAYAYRDFWSQKPKYIRWFFKLASYVIAPLSVLVFNNADVIGVYHDARIMSTFKETLEKLQGGARIVIFPEHDVPHNHIVCDFQDRFIDIARMYYKRTGEELSFVPLYVAPKLKAMYFGKPVRFDHAAPLDRERRRICGYLMDAITGIAVSLPLHTVVPYRNIRKKNYPTNVPKEATSLVRKPVVNYREFRFSRLNEPQFSHIKLLGGWIVYFIFYFLTENLIPLEDCHVIHSHLDDLIPFNEYFAIFYCFWFLLLIASLLYFFLYDIESFKQLQIFIIITQVVAMICYIFYPSVQDLRPAVFPRDNFFTHVMAFIYAFDTPSGVCPSLHVAYSMGIASVWLKYKPAPKAWKGFVVFSVVMISLSTAFVKQHSAIDIAVALPVGLLAEYLVYGTRPEFRKKSKLLAYLEKG